MTYRGRALDILMLVTFSALWGMGYTCVEVADNSIPPVTLMALRSALATVVLVLLCLVLRRPFGQARPWHPAYLIPALLLIAIPWPLIGEGELSIDAGLTSLLTSIMPIGTFLIGVFIVRTDHARWYRVLGILVSVLGLMVAIGIEHLFHAQFSYEGLSLLVLAFLLYAVNGVLLARFGKGLDPLVTCTYAIGYGTILMTASAFVLEKPLAIHPRWQDIESLLLLGIVITAGGYALYFTVVKRAGALFASTWGYLVPIFGVVASAVWLGTPLGWQRILGTALVIAGVLLINLKGSSGTKKPAAS